MKPAGRLLVVTDLDGCLLDPHTYGYEAARPALARLASEQAPVVLCSGKTRAEMQILAEALELRHPFIVENGGAIVFPAESFEGDVPGALVVGNQRVLALGAPRAALIAALRAIAAEAGVRVRGFADLDARDVQELTGLSADAAVLALQREYDEPFVVEDPAALARLERAAQGRGLDLSHGGRFHHVTGGSDKGLATRALLALYGRTGTRWLSVGLGDAQTDLPLLRAVERPIVVPRRDGTLDPRLVAELSTAERAPGPGPAGWNAALSTLLDGERLPLVNAAGAVAP